MDTIDASVIENAAAAIHNLDTDKLGNIHTVTLTLDGFSGGCLVTVASSLAEEITLVLR